MGFNSIGVVREILKQNHLPQYFHYIIDHATIDLVPKKGNISK